MTGFVQPARRVRMSRRAAFGAVRFFKRAIPSRRGAALTVLGRLPQPVRGVDGLRCALSVSGGKITRRARA